MGSQTELARDLLQKLAIARAAKTLGLQPDWLSALVAPTEQPLAQDVDEVTTLRVKGSAP
jgi:hypothetical protein